MRLRKFKAWCFVPVAAVLGTAALLMSSLHAAIHAQVSAKSSLEETVLSVNQYLADKGIPSMIYYPVPAHRQKMFAAFSKLTVELPVTDWLTERVISLPMHTEMEEEQLNFITSNVLGYISQK